jgi:hypothetical protein
MRALGKPGRKNSAQNRLNDDTLLEFLARDSAKDCRVLLEETSSLAALGSSSCAASLLDTWLNNNSHDFPEEAQEAPRCEGYWPKAHYETERPLPNLEFPTPRRKSLENSTLLQHLKKKQPLRAQASGNGRVEILQGAAGERIEIFSNGARLTKDACGRVIEVISEHGIAINLVYDTKGHLQQFHRLDDRGITHSYAESDKQGVLVRDFCGRIKAQGESLQVDPLGCISIGRKDGQFWSLDLVRSVHIERRLLPDTSGNWLAMTALFTADGFRMATRFRKVLPAREENAGKPSFREVHSGLYRFYGRDGSLIEFADDESLHNLCPNLVFASGTRAVSKSHKGRRQAGTAWEALREYRANYLTTI